MRQLFELSIDADTEKVSIEAIKEALELYVTNAYTWFVEEKIIADVKGSEHKQESAEQRVAEAVELSMFETRIEYSEQTAKGVVLVPINEARAILKIGRHAVQLQAEVERLRTALQFYADQLHMTWVPVSAVVEDGTTARTALAEKERKA